MRSKRKRSTISAINITPFVDVMLVLLIVFMITAPMLVSGVNVDLPKTKSTPVQGLDEPLVVSVNKNGFVFLNTTQVSEAELLTKLSAILKEKGDTKVVVKGDKSVDYGAVMRAVAIVNSTGFSKVALLTEVE